MTGVRKLRIGGVQMSSRLGERDDNLSRAARLAAQAAAGGAQLIVFPELMASGYSVSPAIWRCVEPAHGPTARWLAETSTALGVYLGTSFIELDGGHVYNTFVLTGPDGTEAGRVRKTHAETYFFHPGRGSHVIDCPLGRIGVGICADNQYSDFAQQMRRARPDLLLMPHAGPVAWRVGGLVSEQDVREQRELLAGMAPRYARMLGAPVLFVNQCGPTVGRRGTGILGSFIDTDMCRFPGLSTIADSDGQVLAKLDREAEVAGGGGDGADQEGIVCADVTIDPSRYPEREPVLLGKYAVYGRSPAREAVWLLDAGLGRLYYRWRRRSVRLTPANS